MVAVRVVLAVALAVAMVGVAAPAIHDARIDRTTGTVTADLEDLASTARDLARTAPAATDGVPTVRRYAHLSVPAPRAGQAGLVAISIGGPLAGEAPADDETRDLVAYRVRGGPPRRVWIGVDLRVGSPEALAADDEALRIGTAGRHRLALRPVAVDGRVVVAVERVEA